MPLPIYFAPLEGVTDAEYRRVHSAHFTGVAKYFIPFISPTQNLVLTNRERFDVSPANNAGMVAVPQILTKNPEHFLWAANQLMDMGYQEVNINLGCPSGTVTGKGKGSGLLIRPDDLERFLDEVYAKTPVKVSLKTRIGFSSPEEFPELAEIFERYPVHELIVHPRTRSEFYKGTPHRDVYRDVLSGTHLPLVYNGDLFTAQECRAFEAEYPCCALMLGRGLLANPALAREYAGGSAITAEEIHSFVRDTMAAYQTRHPQNVVLGRMREVLKNVICCFESPDKVRKAVRKANCVQDIEDAAAMLCSQYALRENPGFVPER